MRPTVGLRLRQHHVDYLTYVSNWDEVTYSDAFGRIIGAYAPQIGARPRAYRLVRQHLAITPENLSTLDNLTSNLHLQLSEVAQRLIELACQTEAPPHLQR